VKFHKFYSHFSKNPDPDQRSPLILVWTV